MSKENDNSIIFGLGLLAGVVGGIIAAVLYAPQSGEETRADLIDKAKQIKHNFPEKVDCAKEKSIHAIEKTKTSIENLIEDIHAEIKAKKMAHAKEKESKSLKNL